MGHQKGLKILFWNIQSLLTPFDSFKIELEKSLSDIINIEETWLHLNIDNHCVHLKTAQLYHMIGLT